MKILHLEDNPGDASLVGEMIAGRWPDAEITLTEGREDFEKALERGGIDLILSDFSLVAFDGLEALKLARKLAPDTPFVFLSGTIGEDRAIEALRSGASDYILKNSFKRLVPALERALKEAAERREKRTLEERLLRAQRMENIGLLAAGIAHDLNNVLAPILMATPMLRERSKDPTEIKMLNLLEKSAERGAGLVRQILSFAHGAGGEQKPSQLRYVINDILPVVADSFPKSIALEHRVASDLWLVKANPTQVHQVILNLCINARDAMPQGGTLSITAENCFVDAAAAQKIEDGRAGSHVLIEVRDTGTGIPPDVLARMWEPFFTTKESGKGTGLGLSTVRGLVESHEGFLEVRTAVGQGTSFRVYLPAAEGAAAASVPAPLRSIARGNGELILVVDDEKSVRDVAAAMLSRGGYRVLVASDGAEAMSVFSQRIRQIDLVVTDMQMPNFDGAVLSRVLQRLDPSIRILAMSGLSPGSGTGAAPGAAGFGHAFLRKPFTTEALLEKVGELLRPKA